MNGSQTPTPTIYILKKNHSTLFTPLNYIENTLKKMLQCSRLSLLYRWMTNETSWIGLEVRTVHCQGPQRNHHGLALHMHIPMGMSPPSYLQCHSNAVGCSSNKVDVTLLHNVIFFLFLVLPILVGYPALAISLWECYNTEIMPAQNVSWQNLHLLNSTFILKCSSVNWGRCCYSVYLHMSIIYILIIIILSLMNTRIHLYMYL